MTVAEILAEVLSRLDKKAEEYSEAEQDFLMFKTSAQLFNSTVEKEIYHMSRKHMVSKHLHIMQERILPQEVISDKLIDLICYDILLILYGQSNSTKGTDS